jgi:cell division protein FtsI (penicillin-binding protein 3)
VKNSVRSRRRLAIAIALTLAIVGVFIVRLVDIQIVQADELNTASLSKRSIAVKTYAARGEIVDANGVILADSVMRYNITASPRNVGEFKRKVDGHNVTITVPEAADEIAKLTNQDPKVVLQAMTKDPQSNFVYLAKKVTTATLRAVRKLKIPGIYDEPQPVRTYPQGAVAGNLVGFVGTDGPQNGLETMDDTCLAGTDGSSTYEQGADGVQIPGSRVTGKQAVPGGTLKLTIDSDLQWFSQQAIAEQGTAIGAQSGSVVIWDVKTGHLLTVADWPSVDPNNVNLTPNNLGSLAFQAQYEPGSVFKGMSAAILIDTGIGSPTMPATVPSTWHTPEGGTVHDAAPHPVQQLTLTGVLQNSSNVGISMLGSKVPAPVRYEYMKKFGLDQRTAVDFQGEQQGSLAKTWDDQTKYNVLYGQGVAATALQVAGIYQTLGNGGVRLPLSLVQGCTRADGTVTDVPSTQGTRVVSESTAKTVVNMLESVVQGGELSSAVKIPGYRIAGKSGTAEVAENGRYSSDRIVSFVGLAPADNPQYGVLVTYTKPVTMKSSAAAAPTFKKIMAQVLSKYRVPPSTTPSTYPPTTW